MDALRSYTNFSYVIKELQEIIGKIQETHIISPIYHDIKEKYNQERYVSYDLKDACIDWYMNTNLTKNSQNHPNPPFSIQI